MLVALIALLSPKPVDGPAIPLPFKATLVKAVLGHQWCDGLYNVELDYRSKESVQTLAKRCRGVFPTIVRDSPKEGVFSATRFDSAVAQTITIYRPLNAKAGGFTSISVADSVWTGASPKTWYRGAISAKPPVPMPAIPFLPGEHFEMVILQSFEGLMSTAGKMYPETDAASFVHLIHRPYSQVEPLFRKFAVKSGYKKTPQNEYFKAGSGTFQMALEKTGANCTLYFWTSEKSAAHPIEIIKD
jgi:hypothetical protein